jgi:hypothetical protein
MASRTNCYIILIKTLFKKVENKYFIIFFFGKNNIYYLFRQPHIPETGDTERLLEVGHVKPLNLINLKHRNEI